MSLTLSMAALFDSRQIDMIGSPANKRSTKMTFNFLLISFLAIVAASCATAAKNPHPEETTETSKPVSDTVKGFDFAGPQILPAPKPGMICTMELKPEQAACHEAKGKVIKADKCKILCSLPIKKPSP